MTTPALPVSWPDLAIGLYDRRAERSAEITYAMTDLRVAVPSGTGKDATHADRVLNGALRIRTQDRRNAAPN